jgi:hypothetical protein
MLVHPNGPSLPYMYPTRVHSLQDPRQDILMKVYLCIATGRTYTLRAEEIDTVNRKHVSVRLLN